MSEMVWRPEIRDNGWRPRCWFIGMMEKSSAYCLTCPFEKEAEMEDGTIFPSCRSITGLKGRPSSKLMVDGYERQLITHAMELLDPVAMLTMNGRAHQARQNVLDAIANLEALL